MLSAKWMTGGEYQWTPLGKLCAKNHLLSLQWRHDERDGDSNHQPHDCLLNRLFRRRSKKTPKLGVTGRCAGNSPVTGEFPAQMASDAENVSIWWRHHGIYGQKVLSYVLQSLRTFSRYYDVYFYKHYMLYNHVVKFHQFDWVNKRTHKHGIMRRKNKLVKGFLTSRIEWLDVSEIDPNALGCLANLM